MPIILMTSLAMLLSCSKNELGGSFSYKTSGVTSILETSYIEATEEEKLEIEETLGHPILPKQALVVPEQGQIRIIREEDDSLIITLNKMFGGVTVLNAVYDSEQQIITINPEQTISVELEATVKYKGLITLTGTGQVHGDIIIFNLQYIGEVFAAGIGYTIQDSEVTWVLTQNQ